MANPIEFNEANLRLTAPKGDEDTVREMPAYTDGSFCVSCWQLSPEELKELQANDGKLWLWVWSGATQPPVLIDVENPFEQQTPIDDLVQANAAPCALCGGNTPSIEQATTEGSQYCKDCGGTGKQ